jgi:hypothetical protein
MHWNQPEKTRRGMLYSSTPDIALSDLETEINFTQDDLLGLSGQDLNPDIPQKTVEVLPTQRQIQSLSS